MKLSLKSIARFTRQMATYQDSFVDIRKALNSMSEGTGDSRMSASLRRVLERVKDGDSLFEAFGREGTRYPVIFLRMTKVGEEAGTLAAVYHQLADYLDQQVAMRRRFFSRMIYPSLMVVALIVILSLVRAVTGSISAEGSVSIQQIEKVFVMNALQGFGVVAAIVGAILIARMLFVGRSVTDGAVLFIPGLAGAFRKLVLYRFSLSMYLMTGSAIGMPEAVRESGKATNNALFAHSMEKVARQLEDGVGLTEALSESMFFPREFLDIVEVAEESGTVSESLKRLTPHYAEDAEIALNRIVSTIAWGAYLTVAGIMAYHIIKMFAGYVGAISSYSQGT
jgi:type IV pilus assembly protein PilC